MVGQLFSQSKLTEAINYALNHWDGLTLFPQRRPRRGRFQHGRAFDAPDCNGKAQLIVQRQRRRRRELGDSGIAGQHGKTPRTRSAGLSGRRAGAHRLRANQEPSAARASRLELEGGPRAQRTGRPHEPAAPFAASPSMAAAAMPLDELESMAAGARRAASRRHEHPDARRLCRCDRGRTGVDRARSTGSVRCSPSTPTHSTTAARRSSLRSRPSRCATTRSATPCRPPPTGSSRCIGASQWRRRCASLVPGFLRCDAAQDIGVGAAAGRQQHQSRPACCPSCCTVATIRAVRCSDHGREKMVSPATSANAHLGIPAAVEACANTGCRSATNAPADRCRRGSSCRLRFTRSSRTATGARNVGERSNRLTVSDRLLQVKVRRTQPEQMSSGLPLTADTARPVRHVSNVPTSDIALLLFSERGDKLAVSLKPLRLLQTDDLHTQFNAFIANRTGGLLAFWVHGYRVD